MANSVSDGQNLSMLSEGRVEEAILQPRINISFVIEDSGEAVSSFRALHSMLLKWLCKAYSKDKNVSLKSIRFSFDGKLLFLSSVGKKKLEDLGLKDGSVIQVSLSPVITEV